VLVKIKGLFKGIRFASSLPYWERRSYLRYFFWAPILNLRHFPRIAFSAPRYLDSLRLKIRSDSLALDLGCGSNPHNPLDCKKLYGVDVRQDLDAASVLAADLSSDKIPYEDGLFDCVSAFDFLEHIPRFRVTQDGDSRLSLVELINDVYRVLAPQGYFIHLTPAYPGPLAFRDPTHINFITDETFPLYFCGSAPWAEMYGFKGRFELVGQVWIRDAWLLCVMQKSG